VRITGGSYRSRKVQCPPGVIRPAMDRMRESMFSILGTISGLAFLDLFTGSAVVGIEAASRGAEPVVLVEKDRRKAPVIRKNLEFVESDIRLILQPAERFIAAARKNQDKPADGMQQQFDIIYLDPPFKYEHKIKLIQSVAAGGLLSPHGRCLIHHPSQEEWPDRIEQLECSDVRSYGGSTLRFFTEAGV
jgi:16S rRNA (guanine966-N2)-methyltransferase